MADSLITGRPKMGIKATWPKSPDYTVTKTAETL